MPTVDYSMSRRPYSIEMDHQIDVQHDVLDKGFIRVVDYMGNDAAVCQAARVSYGAGTKTVNEDRGLIRYLMRHRHTTPFEMCEIKLHVKLPVFVARQWIRHRTANVNEYSARYSILDREFYFPEPKDVKPQSKTNKQGRDGDLPVDVKHSMIETIRQVSEGNYQVYDELRTGWPWFNEDGSVKPGHVDPDDTGPHEQGHGMAREMARMVLPTNIYTQWYWKVDLHNLLHFLSLRADPHAQYEIRVYAEKICELIKPWVPHTFEAFEDYVMGAHTFSRQEMDALRSFFDSIAFDRESDGWPEPNGVSGREQKEFFSKLGLTDADSPS